MSRERASRERIALYTTVYPGVERYLGEWWRSVAARVSGRSRKIGFFCSGPTRASRSFAEGENVRPKSYCGACNAASP